jgi:hypothetical protein
MSPNLQLSGYDQMQQPALYQQMLQQNQQKQMPVHHIVIHTNTQAPDGSSIPMLRNVVIQLNDQSQQVNAQIKQATEYCNSNEIDKAMNILIPLHNQKKIVMSDSMQPMQPG